MTTPEITCRGIVLAIVLTIVLATANTYLALKVGLLTSASIPAAILAMVILRFFPNSNVLENNQVQTCASAGEAVAGGVVYALPALVIIHYWGYFDYWQTFLIAFIGGTLGIICSIPLRRFLVHQKDLPFPEGKAIAAVLKFQSKSKVGVHDMLLGGAVAGFIQLFQNGFKIIATQIQLWFSTRAAVYGIGFGFSPTLLGAGYLIGFDLGSSLLMGAMFGWGFGIPLLSHFMMPDARPSAHMLVNQIWNHHLRYIGIGAMLVASLWTLLTLLKPFFQSLKMTPIRRRRSVDSMDQRECDLPSKYRLMMLLFLFGLLFYLFHLSFHLDALPLPSDWHLPFLLLCFIYVLLVSFLLCAICGYFSGLVGVSVSPGSAVIIAGMLMLAFLINALINHYGSSAGAQFEGSAITIIIGSIIMTAACIANDNLQDLKVGQLVGATPYKQQLMLFLGVFIATLIIPAVMDLLFKAYGIVGIHPAGTMPVKHIETLAAPPAALLAGITQGIFDQNFPWKMVSIGGLAVFLLLSLKWMIERLCNRRFNLSILGVAMGVYLPLSTTTPLFLGSWIQYFVLKNLRMYSPDKASEFSNVAVQRGTLIACGFVAGGAITDVILAMPVVLNGDLAFMNLMPASFQWLSPYFGLVAMILMSCWFYRRVCQISR